MDKFRTEIHILPSDNKISHKSKILMVGSCFTEYIGALMMKYKFDLDINPIGIVYNPFSASSCLNALIDNKVYRSEDLFETNGRFVSFDHHGHFSDPDPDICLKHINSRIKQGSYQLKNAAYAIITFGTAWVYRLDGSGRIVSNNHKLPARHFTRELLKVDNIVGHYQQLIKDIRDFNPTVRLIFTVSPVRHWKDGAPMNMVSKSTLILAIHELMRLFDFTEYFPSYELAMDDLRDYRFYDEDMIHPNAQMTSYIWQKFSETYFGQDTMDLVRKLESINKALSHKSFYPGSEEYKTFVNKQLKLVDEVKRNHPYLDLSSERAHFENQFS
jgi:hypothetical protein